MMVLDIESLKDARITLTLIFVNILSFFLIILAAPEEVILFLVQINRNIINEYEIWRLITAMFLHGDILHLFSNMFGLLLFGATIENNKDISKIQFLLIYFLSGLIGNLFSLFLLSPTSISLGASGAIFGLIGVVFTMIATDEPTLLFFAFFYIVFFIVTSFLPGINFWAHIFGLLAGIAFGYLFYTRKRNRLTY
ncbi:MAG: rhomboid family intramembrane serine protease [Candidatus Lokiarchaeota archaeon]|nr:rhomboid family intramembrane serine protease [Candidatus Lokiarchaeota archaeon]